MIYTTLMSLCGVTLICYFLVMYEFKKKDIKSFLVDACFGLMFLGLAFFIFLTLFIPTETNVTDNNFHETSVIEQQTEQSLTGESTAPSTPAHPAEKKDEPEQQARTNIIPGIFPVDIYMNLENAIGMEFEVIRPVHERIPGCNIGFIKEGRYDCPDTGILLKCYMESTSPLDVVLAQFVVDSAIAAGIADDDVHLDLAKAYFGLSATVPYEGSDPDKARAWVEENIGSFHEDAPGAPIKMSIGTVEFELAGTRYLKILTLRAIQNEAVQ